MHVILLKFHQIPLQLFLFVIFIHLTSYPKFQTNKSIFNLHTLV